MTVKSGAGEGEQKEREKAKGKHGWEIMEGKARMIFLSEKTIVVKSLHDHESPLTFSWSRVGKAI